MFNKHLFKTLVTFVLIIGVGFIGFTMINNYQEKAIQAKALQNK